MHEIVTLQLGQVSNYVATHFWNAQESYFTYSSKEESPINHDVHWRPGVGSDGADTYLPRTVVYDFKANFGTLRKLNALYDPEPDIGHDSAQAFSLWDGKPILQKQDPLRPSAYQQSLDTGSAPPQLNTSTVRYWSDYSRVYYHPKSLIQLHDFELNSATQPFDRYGTGLELFETLDRDHDLLDRDFRPFAEECDMMQGIQVFTSLEDAWGGFSARYLEAVRDEYPKSCIWLWGVEAPVQGLPRQNRHLRLVNMARSIAETTSTASLLSPMSLLEGAMPSHTAIDTSAPWHVSALYATAIESMTTPSRLVLGDDGTGASLRDMTEKINTDGNRPLAALQMRVGPGACKCESDSEAVQFFRLRHIFDRQRQAYAGRPLGSVISSRGKGFAGIDEANSDTQDNRLLDDNATTTRYGSSLNFPLLDSFPRIYKFDRGVDVLDVQTTMSTDTSISHSLNALKNQIVRSINSTEREDLANRLTDIADAYKDDWYSSGDEGEDDM